MSEQLSLRVFYDMSAILQVDTYIYEVDLLKNIWQTILWSKRKFWIARFTIFRQKLEINLIFVLNYLSFGFQQKKFTYHVAKMRFF